MILAIIIILVLTGAIVGYVYRDSVSQFTKYSLCATLSFITHITIMLVVYAYLLCYVLVISRVYNSGVYGVCMYIINEFCSCDLLVISLHVCVTTKED